MLKDLNYKLNFLRLAYPKIQVTDKDIETFEKL